MTAAANPQEIDAQACELALTLPGQRAHRARRGLMALAARGHSTNLDCEVDPRLFDELDPPIRWGLRSLWSTARAAGLRKRDAPAPHVRSPYPRPPDVDVAAWDLAGTLPPNQATNARSGLRKLSAQGHPTDLDCDLDVRRFSELTAWNRRGLRRLWAKAKTLGLRSRNIPPTISRYEIECADDVDRATVGFLHELAFRGQLVSESRWVWFWLKQLRDQGLPTNPDVDLDSGSVQKLWQHLFALGRRGLLDAAPSRDDQLALLRAAMRAFYRSAAAAGLRQRPVPPAIAVSYDLRGNTARMRSLLPPRDHERVDALFEALDELAARQQAGKWTRRGRWKDTRAQNTVENLASTLNVLIAHARDAGWRLELDEILTPDHVVDWCMRGHRKDGSVMSEGEPDRRWGQLFSLLKMAADIGRPLIDSGRIEALRQAVNGYRGPRNTEGRPRGRRKEKFIPTREQILDGIAFYQEFLSRARIQYENGRMTRLRCHRALQEAKFFVTCMKGMWRTDSSATIDLLQTDRDVDTGIVTVDGVRAKETGDDHYVQILLLPEMVDDIEELLAFEGRSIERPLRDGERPQVLRADRTELRNGRRIVLERGDRWGADRLKNDDIQVANLLRKHPDRPEGMSYRQVADLRRRILWRLRWIGATPHTLRVAGAIYWRMCGWDYEQIMKLGLWRDMKTLLECYAALNEKDQRAVLAGLTPSRRNLTPRALSDRRQAALVRAQRVLMDILLSKEPKLVEYERLAQDLRGCVDDVDRANAAQRGRQWVAPRVPRVTDEELIKVDEVVRESRPKGIADVLGRNVFASDRIAERRREAAIALQPSDRPRRLIARSFDNMAQPTALSGRTA